MTELRRRMIEDMQLIIRQGACRVDFLAFSMQLHVGKGITKIY